MGVRSHHRASGAVAAPLPHAAPLRPPARQPVAGDLPAARGQSDEEIVRVEEVRELGAVREVPVLLFEAGQEPFDLKPVEAGHDVGAEFSQEVVEGGGALAPLRLEAKEHAALGEFKQAFSRLARGWEVQLRDLVNGEDLMLVEVEADVPVPRGEPPCRGQDIRSRDAGKSPPLAGLTSHRPPSRRVPPAPFRLLGAVVGRHEERPPTRAFGWSAGRRSRTESGRGTAIFVVIHPFPPGLHLLPCVLCS